MTSDEYWRKREEEALKHYITDEKEYDREIRRIYREMLDGCQKEINSFYGKYARKEGITIAEAKKRVSKLDIAAYERKAKKYVREKNFSEKANAEMRLYNATMKINRLEMLKANIGLELISGHNELDRLMSRILKGRTMDELKRQAGILGKSVLNNGKKAHAIVNGSFHNATFSDRIWQYQDIMKADLAKLLQSGLIGGKNARALTADLRKYLIGDKMGKGATYNVERLMRTELARVQTEAQRQSFIRNGFEMYTFHVNGGCCDVCAALNGKHFKVSEMMPGENAPPMHPHCRCSTSAYEDTAEYEAWLDYLSNGGTTEEWKKLKAKNPGVNVASLATMAGKKGDIIESKYGFNYIKGEHTREDDLRDTNPNYKTHKREWTQNCQRCVSAYEARRRGFNVEALPRILDGSDRMPYMFDKKGGWTSVYDGIKPILCSSNRTAGVKAKVEAEMRGFGDGARAIVRVQWQQKYGGGGHVFIAEQTDGKTIFIDPQNNKTDVSDYFQLAKVRETYVMRIDNLEFTDNIKLCCKNAE